MAGATECDSIKTDYQQAEAG